MIRRNILGRYQGSIFGVTWSFFNPIVMLVVYTFVFSVVFKARWPGNDDASQSQFALILFAGMIVFGLFSEVIGSAPTLIIGNSNFVKKVIFPLELLSVINVGAAAFHALIGCGILLATILILNGFLYWTVLYFPLVFLPFLVFILGLSWLFSSLGVYIRDLSQAMGVIITIVMFLSPLFYPITALPERFQVWMMLNPLTFIIQESRNIFIFGVDPDWTGLLIYFLVALTFSWISYIWFQKTRKGFADVL